MKAGGGREGERGRDEGRRGEGVGRDEGRRGGERDEGRRGGEGCRDAHTTSRA